MKNSFLNLFITFLIPSFIIDTALGLYPSSPYSFSVLNKWHMVVIVLIFSVLSLLLYKGLKDIFAHFFSEKFTVQKSATWVTTPLLIFFSSYEFFTVFVKFGEMTPGQATFTPTFILLNLLLEVCLFSALISLILTSVSYYCFYRQNKKIIN